jgi:hypothetical protein
MRAKWLVALTLAPIPAIVASAVLIALTTFSEPHSAQGIILPRHRHSASPLSWTQLPT